MDTQANSHQHSNKILCSFTFAALTIKLIQVRSQKLHSHRLKLRLVVVVVVE